MTPADHFSRQAPEYRRFRPRYPAALFHWLAAIAPGRVLAWDAGTGSGQAAAALADHFGQVVATDPSAAQLSNVIAHPRVRYLATAEECAALATAGVDLVTVAQAVHWFNLDRFYREVDRVLKPAGVIAVWTYTRAVVRPEVDAVLDHFHDEIVGPYWPPERVMVDTGYRNIPFPFARIAAPPFEIRERWTAARFLDYVRTWSSVQHYLDAEGRDPVALIESTVADAWGTAQRDVTWPLALLAGKRTAP